MGFPFKQVAWVQRVRPEFENTSQLARRRSWPETELLHKGNVLGPDQLLQLPVKLGKLRVVLDPVKRGVIACVALVLPYMHCSLCQSTAAA